MKSLALRLALIGLLLAGLAGAQEGSKSKSNLNKLKSDLGSLQSRKSSVRQQLRRTQGEVRQARGDLYQIDSKLDSVGTSLATTTAQLASNRERQARLADELKAAGKKLDETKEQVRGRLKWMYIHQEQSVLAAFVNAKDVSDIASRAYLMKRIAKADRELFQDYIALRDETAAKKRKQDALVVEIAHLKQDQESQKAELASTRSDKAVVLGGLVRKQQDLERIVRQLDREEAALAAQIAAYNASAGKTTGLKPFTGRFSKPVDAPVTSGYGMRFHPILKVNRLHAGIDFGARHGSPIRAAADGIVFVATYSQGYGNMVVIDHGGGISTLYGHCSSIAVRSGQRVSRGETIGRVGSTGLATGPHLHWEVRLNGKPVNPSGKY